jgi:hypothetical protein
VPKAGYSKRALGDKLGIKPGTAVVALGAPAAYPSLLGPLGQGVILRSRLSDSADFIHYFARRHENLQADFPRLSRALTDQGALWISWPKRASGVETDLDENVIREIGLLHGLVDVKVCAVDEVWSGLKFVRRVSNRAKTSARATRAPG